MKIYILAVGSCIASHVRKSSYMAEMGWGKWGRISQHNKARIFINTLGYFISTGERKQESSKSLVRFRGSVLLSSLLRRPRHLYDGAFHFLASRFHKPPTLAKAIHSPKKRTSARSKRSVNV